MAFLAPVITLFLALPLHAQKPMPLPTGSFITPAGEQTGVGSFPANMVLSPNGRFVVVTDTGFRSFLSVLDARTGRVVSSIGFNAKRADKPKQNEGLYVGLAFGPSANDGSVPLYVARGEQEFVSVFTLGADGTLAATGRTLNNASSTKTPNRIAGLGTSGDGTSLYAACNNANVPKPLAALAAFDTATGQVRGVVALPAYPFAVAVPDKGPAAGRKVYVASEAEGVVSDVDPAAMSVRRSIATGDHPMGLLLDAAQRRLFVANAGSDTVSVVSTATDAVTATILLRPAELRGLSCATPTGMALSRDEKRLYVTLADLNAVAVVQLGASPQLLGYVPTGWYPTAVLAAPDGRHVFVANAKGAVSRHPNTHDRGPNGAWKRYTQNILEGTVARITLPAPAELGAMTARVLLNNRVAAVESAPNPVAGLPIKHVIYIIKENRTYDQVLGDVAKGNGDASVTLFGRNVTPNQHALAERFALLDNYYCAGEVSSDGWNWSLSGMGSEFTERNVPVNYGKRSDSDDYGGSNAGVAVDIGKIKDVAAAPGGYLWDACARSNVSYRSYGVFADNDVTLPNGQRITGKGTPVKRVLQGHTDPDYCPWSTLYADSDAWKKLDAPGNVKAGSYGRYAAPSRYSEWKREFDGYVKNGNLPALSMLCMCRDHTAGTSVGQAVPAAMVTDNDYAVGEVVEAVSHSPYWKSTAIFVVEDDAQAGYDHVDAHRSTVYVISPYVKPGVVDHRFYNTDSTLHTMERLLNLPPMSRYDAAAPVMDIWSRTPDNAAPYTATLPDPALLRQVNAATAYRAQESNRLPFNRADAVPDQELNDILWHAVKGAKTPAPPIHHSLLTAVDDKD